MRIRKTFWAVFGILIFTLTSYALTGARIYSRVASLSGFLIAASFIWTYLALRGVQVRRSARFLRQQVGQVLEERYEIANNFPLSKLVIEIRDDSTLPGRNGSRVLTWIGARQRRSYISYTRLSQRGQFLLGPTRVISGDPFGLFSTEFTLPGERYLLVLPYMLEIQNMPTPAGFLPGGRALRRRTLEVTPYAAGVREYAPGDALNRIHWPTSARKDRLMVKEFDQDPQADIWIFVDAQHDVHLTQNDQVIFEKVERFWLWRDQYRVSLPASTFEYAVSLAATMANYYIRLGRAVGLACAGESFLVVSPERGERQLGKLLEMLAYVRSDGNLPLMGLVETQGAYMTRGSTVILITPAVDIMVEGAVEELIHRDLKPVMVMIDRTSFMGYGDFEGALLRLKTRRIPVAVVKRGDDLKEALEHGF